jgi:hypothetical protein
VEVRMTSKQDRPPNWRVWRLRKPTIWQAVALSMNIDPDKVRLSRIPFDISWTHEEPNFQENKEFSDRLDMIRDNSCEIEGLPPNPIRASCDAQINLLRLAQWALSHGWDIPTELAKCGPPEAPPETEGEHVHDFKSKERGLRTGNSLSLPEQSKVRSQPKFKRALECITQLYPGDVPSQAHLSNAILCREVGEKLKSDKQPISDDTILRAAGRR